MLHGQPRLILERLTTIESKSTVCVESPPNELSGRVVIADLVLIGKAGGGEEEGQQ